MLCATTMAATFKEAITQPPVGTRPTDTGTCLTTTTSRNSMRTGRSSRRKLTFFSIKGQISTPAHRPVHLVPAPLLGRVGRLPGVVQGEVVETTTGSTECRTSTSGTETSLRQRRFRRRPRLRLSRVQSPLQSNHPLQQLHPK